MKNLILLPFIVLFVIYSNLSAQSFKNIDQGLRVQHGDIIAVDIDNDRDLDIIVSGEDHGGKSGVYINKKMETGTFSFVPQTAPNPTTYTNPVYNSDAADPTIVKAADGWFYAYSTSNPFQDGSYHHVPVLRSKNLTQWEYLGDAYQDKAPWFVEPTYKADNFGYWAPDVNYYNGKYYMYYSVASRTSNTQPTAIGIASSDSPFGPFSDLGMVLNLSSESKPAGIIDPFLFIDGTTPYLFFGSFDGIYGYQMNTDLKTKAGARFKIAGNSFEGTYITKHGSYYYFIASSGECCGDGSNPYHLTVARSTNLAGPYLNALGENILTDGKQGKLLLQQNSKWLSPGHNANIFTDDSGDDFILYHAIDAANPLIGSTGAPRRVLLMDRVIWTNDWPEIVGFTPSTTAQTGEAFVPYMNPLGSETPGASKVITPGHFADIKFGDIDGDSDLDAIFNGNSSPNNIGIALNQGNGVFSKSITHSLSTGTISNGFADFDNNGLLDYYQSGNQGDQTHLYYQQADGSFTHTSLPTDYWDPDLTLVDFNNDGWVDIFISAGWDDNINARAAGVYINNNGSFGATYIPVPVRKGFGSASWADIDNDGYMDLLLNGDGGADGEASDHIYRLYKNNAGIGFIAKVTFNDYRQISVGDGSRFVDINNDGNTDIVLTGWSNTLNKQATKVFVCTDPVNFTFVDSGLDPFFPGVSESSIEVGDIDKDGRTDILLTGYSGGTTEGVTYNRNITGYVLNNSSWTPNVNAKPTAVTGLSSNLSNNTGSSADVTLSWSATSDDRTSANALTYNLYLKNTTTGKIFYNPMADAATGFRRVIEHGNMFGVKSKTLKGLPYGTYEWNIQAIDAIYAGSSFASNTNSSFTISTVTSVNSFKNDILFSAKNGSLIIDSQSDQHSLVNVYSITGILLKQLQFTKNVSFELNKGIYILETQVSGIKKIQKFCMN